MVYLNKIWRKIRSIFDIISRVDERFDELKINQGIILSELLLHKNSKHLCNYEFKVFSQWGEDGIIQYLIRSINITNKTFIEFGVGNFLESNCRFLLMKDNWRGFVIDGSESNILNLKKSYFYWKYDIQAINKFITKDNIESVLASSGFDSCVGILSIDLDGNDYYILQAINNFSPCILICEYNSVFGGDRKISIPYQENFDRTKSHFSNLYWGASLGAITFVAKQKGYSLVGTNSARNNAFYVRNDLLNDNLEVCDINEIFKYSAYREAKDEQGNLTYVSGDMRAQILKNLPVFNVEKEIIEKF